MVCTFEAFHPQSCVLWKSLFTIKTPELLPPLLLLLVHYRDICYVTVTSVHGRQENRSCGRNPVLDVIFQHWMVIINAGLNMAVCFSWIAWGNALFSLYMSRWNTKWYKSRFLHMETLTQHFVPVIRSGISFTPFVVGRDRRGKVTTLTSRNLLFLDSKFCEIF